MALGGSVGVAVVACNSAATEETPLKKAVPQSNTIDAEEGVYAKSDGSLPTADPGEVKEGYKPWSGPHYMTEDGTAFLTAAQLSTLPVGTKFRVVYTAEIADGYTGTPYTHVKEFVVAPALKSQTQGVTVRYNENNAAPTLDGYGEPKEIETNYVAGKTLPGTPNIFARWQFEAPNGSALPSIEAVQNITVTKGVWSPGVFAVRPGMYREETIVDVANGNAWRLTERGSVPDLPQIAKGQKWTSVKYYSINAPYIEANMLGVQAYAPALPTPAGVPNPTTLDPIDGYNAFTGPRYVVYDEKMDASDVAGVSPSQADQSAVQSVRDDLNEVGKEFLVFYTATPKSGNGTNLTWAFKYKVYAGGTLKTGPADKNKILTPRTEDEVKALAPGETYIAVYVASPDSDLYATTVKDVFTYVEYFEVARSRPASL